MALTKITKSGITNSAVDNNKIEADAVDATKIADNAISEEHLDETVITGNTELSASAASDDVLLIYDTSSGTIKKILASNVGLQAPTISSVSPTSVTSGDGTGNYTFTITGTGFTTGATAKLVNTSGTDVNFDTVTRDSTTQITGVIAKSSLPGSGEPYDVKVVLTNGISGTLENQINIDQSPTYNTAAGSLGSIGDGDRDTTTLTVEAFDPESAGNVTFELQSGSLPAGTTATTVHENGVSKYQISGFSAVGSDTTSNFTLRAVDAASNTTSRSFSITVLTPTVEVFNASGTFAVPSGVSSLDVLVVAGGGSGGRATSGNTSGGGGGAGGLIFMPSYPATPGGTITVTIGCGGGATPAGGTGGQPSASTVGQDSSFGSPGDPGFSPTSSVLTAKGGGGAGNETSSGAPGGSGGGAGYNNPVGSATQPTQPGNSGAYGFGNNGGPGGGGTGTDDTGGGGGAGAVGGPGSGLIAGNGGVGRAYTIADGTTPVFYAGGGGGGGGYDPACAPNAGTGGSGGGGDGGGPTAAPCGGASYVGQPGTANRGGGGGGGGRETTGTPCGGPGGAGGKGIVIVSWT
jgi:hypothetical protein